MTYALTLTTDEYTLRGEIYEREDGKGWEYRLSYSPRVFESPKDDREYPRVWDSASGEMLPTWLKGPFDREQVEAELRKRFAFIRSTLILFTL